jgi:hypothetical protein
MPMEFIKMILPTNDFDENSVAWSFPAQTCIAWVFQQSETPVKTEVSEHWKNGRKNFQ